MGLVTGTTTHKLDQIRTYNPTTPYVVGTNGVTAIYTDSEGIETIEYTIGYINYTTKLTKNIYKVNKPEGITSLNYNNPISSNNSYVPGRQLDNIDVEYPTTFRYTTTGITEDNYFVFKDEVKMGVVFTPKVYEDVFIERKPMSVFESQVRLSNIKTLDDLEEYNNGYYKVTKID